MCSIQNDENMDVNDSKNSVHDTGKKANEAFDKICVDGKSLSLQSHSKETKEESFISKQSFIYRMNHFIACLSTLTNLPSHHNKNAFSVEDELKLKSIKKGKSRNDSLEKNLDENILAIVDTLRSNREEECMESNVLTSNENFDIKKSRSVAEKSIIQDDEEKNSESDHELKKDHDPINCQDILVPVTNDELPKFFRDLNEYDMNWDIMSNSTNNPFDCSYSQTLDSAYSHSFDPFYPHDEASEDVPEDLACCSKATCYDNDSNLSNENKGKQCLFLLPPPRLGPRRRSPIKYESLPSIHLPSKNLINYPVPTNGMNIQTSTTHSYNREHLIYRNEKNTNEKVIKSGFFRKKVTLVKNDFLKQYGERSDMASWKEDISIEEPKSKDDHVDICFPPLSLYEALPSIEIKDKFPPKNKPLETKLLWSNLSEAGKVKDQDIDFLVSEVKDDVDSLFQGYFLSYNHERNMELSSLSSSTPVNSYHTSIITMTTSKMMGKKIKTALEFISNMLQARDCQKVTQNQEEMNEDTLNDVLKNLELNSLPGSFREIQPTKKSDSLHEYEKDYSNIHSFENKWNPTFVTVDNNGFLFDPQKHKCVDQSQQKILTNYDDQLVSPTSIVWFLDETNKKSKQGDTKKNEMIDNHEKNKKASDDIPDKSHIDMQTSLSNTEKAESKQTKILSESGEDGKELQQLPFCLRPSPLAKLNAAEESAMKRIEMLRKKAAEKMQMKDDISCYTLDYGRSFLSSVALDRTDGDGGKVESKNVNYTKWKSITAKLDFVEIEMRRQIDQLRKNIVNATCAAWKEK